MTLGQIGVPSKPLTHGKRLIITAQIFGWLIHVAIFVSMWGQPRELIWMAVLCVIGAGGNVLIPVYGMPRLGYDRGETLRTGFNVVAHVPVGILCDWSFVSWLFVPFLSALATTTPARHAAPARTGGAARFARPPDRALLFVVPPTHLGDVVLQVKSIWQDRRLS